MRYSLADLAERMFNRPVAISPQKAQIILGALGPRLNIAQLVMAGDERPTPIAKLAALAATEREVIETRPGDRDLARRDWDTGAVVTPYEVWNGVAVLKVRGTLMAEGGLDPASGATSYAGLDYKARYALADPQVRGIVIDHDSGGGEVVDLFELCATLREVAAVKPMRSIVRGTCASADYALACCAGSITCAPYSLVGSIGALIAHCDMSQALANEGVAVTLIQSAPHKTDGHPALPLAEDVRAKLQREVDASAATFIAHVAECRGKSIDEIAAQEAAFYGGAEGLTLGLVDTIMPWDDSLKEFAEAVNRQQPLAATPRGTPAGTIRGAAGMDPENLAPAANTQPVITTNLTDEEAMRKAGMSAERERIVQLAEIDPRSTLSAELTAAITAGTSAGDFAIGLAKASRESQAAALAGARSDAAKPDALPTPAAKTGAAAETNRGVAAVAALRGKHRGLPAEG